MTPEELFASLQKKVADLSDQFDQLQFNFWKKTGPSPSGISNTDLESTNFSTGVSGWRLDADGNLEANNGNFRGDITGASGTFTGTVTVASLNIPDQTTGSSAHVDSSGNTWWGANVATGYTGANAYVLATGAASFKNVLIGGTSTQYQIGNGGMFSFGNGVDGAGVADGSTALAGATLAGSTYTLTRDVYYTNLTVSTGVTISPVGWRIFGTGILTLNGTATIQANGSSGGDGASSGGATGGAGGSRGAQIAAGYVPAGPDGGVGGAGGNSNGTGTSVGGATATNAIGTAGVAGGSGGNGGGGNAGGTSGAGTITAPNVPLTINWNLGQLLDVGSTGATVKYNGSGGAGGGGGGGGGTAGAGSAGGGGGGGGSGSGGTIIPISFRSIIVGASASITANGGNGGKGGDGHNAVNVNTGGGGGGGGGSGGTGGVIILAYNSLSNSGSIVATGGTKGTKGTFGLGNGTGVNGSAGVDGSNGAAGVLYQFQISM